MKASHPSPRRRDRPSAPRRPGRGRAAQALRPSLLAWSIATAFAVAPVATVANPQGGVAVVGTASMNYQGNQLTVTTTNGAGGSHSAINWQSFSIPAGNSTYFQQPGAASTSLNRVVTNTPSQIYGTLGSNGKLVLINQSGIAVGTGAVVDTAGFTASAMRISDADFAAGRLRFETGGVTGGGITVQGNIIARNGDVVLIAPNVQVAQTGVVEAPGGTAILAAGQKVEVTGRGLEGIRLEVQAPADKAVNLGTLKGDAVGIFAGSLRHSGLIRANGVSVEGGRVVLRATELAEVDGRIEAQRTTGGAVSGGSVEISARVVTQNGVVEAVGTSPGAAGGQIVLTGQAVLQGGTLDASGAGAGGSIQVIAARAVEQTAGAVLRAEGGSGAGGSVRVQATDADAGYVMTSAEISADGAQGGQIQVLAPDIRLLAAAVRAEGRATSAGDGGRIEIGGGYQGQNPSLPNSRHVFINNASNLSASSRRNGRGGTVIVWSDGVTRFGGNILARGGAEGGDGGFIEVSGKDSLTFAGMADASAPMGRAGTLLLDPKDIIIDDVAPGGMVAIALNDTARDPGELAGTPGTPGYLPGTQSFGAKVVVMDGRVVVADPWNDALAAEGGAVFVFSATNGALTGVLRGDIAHDRVGQPTAYGFGTRFEASPLDAAHELLLVNPGWGDSKGAITFLRPGTFTGAQVVSSSNSFVGTTGGVGGDGIGSGGYITLQGPAGTALLFGSPNWAGGKGAVLKVSNAAGDTVRSGVVDATTALVGKTTDDNAGNFGYGSRASQVIVGGGEGSAYQDAFVIRMAHFDNDRGAVTLGRIGEAMTGEIGSAGNMSLTGSTPGDKVGQNVMPVWNGASYDWVVGSPYWDNGAATDAGAVTLIRGFHGVVDLGAVSTTNSLVGTHANDKVGAWSLDFPYDAAIYSLNYHGYVLLANPNWHDGRGAVTQLKVAASEPRVTGELGEANSLVGSAAGDRVGSRVEFNWDNGNYFVIAPDWGNGSGAVVWGGKTLGVKGRIDDDMGKPSAFLNAIVGKEGDHVGEHVQWLDDRLLVLSPRWADDHGLRSDMGAITVLRSDASPKDYLTNPAGDPSSRIVSAANSVVGSMSGDMLGHELVWQYDYGEGGYTWVPVSRVDHLGGGWWAVGSPEQNGKKGAVTFVYTGSGTTANTAAAKQPKGYLEATSSTNISLLGAEGYDYDFSGDRYGRQYQVQQPYWGAGRVAVINPDWRYERGAVTMLDLAAMDQSMVVGASNSLVGSNYGYYDYYWEQFVAGDRIGENWKWSADGQRLIVASQTWDRGRGAVAVTGWGGDNNVGAVSAGNAFVGTIADTLAEGYIEQFGDRVGSGLVQELGNGKLLIASPRWSNERGAVSVLPMGAVQGTVDATPGTGNSMVGELDGDQFGEGLMARHVIRPDGGSTVVVASPGWRESRGVITWINGDSPGGTVNTSTNSLAGASADDRVGHDGFIGKDSMAGLDWAEGYIPVNLALSPLWNNYRGAITRIDATPKTGTVGAANSFVGDIGGGEGDKVGADIVYTYCYGDDCYSSLTDKLRAMPDGALVYDNHLGGGSNGRAVTVFAPESAYTGTLGDANSIVQRGVGVASDMVLTFSGNHVLLTQGSWDGNRGAIRVLDTSATASPGVTAASNTGPTSASNALVGANAGDMVGSGYTADYSGRQPFAVGGGKFLVASPRWDADKGALTLVDVASPVTGVLGSGNSLVGHATYSFGRYDLYDWLDSNLHRFQNGKLLLVNRFYEGSPDGYYDSGVGAITVIDPSAPLTGVLNTHGGTLHGDANTQGGLWSIKGLGEGVEEADRPYRYAYTSYVIRNSSWNNNRGAVTVFNQTGVNPSGDVTASNALIGSAPDDRVGGGRIWQVDGGKFIVGSPDWGGTKGAISWGTISGGSATLAPGVVSAANSLVGRAVGDYVGDGVGAEGQISPVSALTHTPGRYAVGIRNFDGGKGAYSFVNWGQTGEINLAETIVSPYGSGFPNLGFDAWTPEHVGGGLYWVRFSNQYTEWWLYPSPNPGQVFLTNGGAGGGAYTGGLLFGDAAGSSVTITPQRITDITNTGTMVVLQANNDITVNSAVLTNNPSGRGGDLWLEAGRSIAVNADIATDGGSLMLWANSSNANAAHRDSGPGGIVVAAGKSLNLSGGDDGNGDLVVRVDTGAGGGKPGGGILLGDVVGAEGMLVQNLSTTAHANVVQRPGTHWGSAALALETRATDGGNIGTLDQPIQFSASQLAVRSQGGPADLHHTGYWLYIETPFSEYMDTVPTIQPDPGWRGIQLAGMGSLNLTSDGTIYISAGATDVEVSAHNIYLGAQNGINVTGYEAQARVLARGDLTLEAPNVFIGGGDGHGGKASVKALNDVHIFTYDLSVYGGEGTGNEARLEAGRDLLVRAGEVDIYGGDGTDAQTIVKAGRDIDFSLSYGLWVKGGYYGSSPVRIEAGRDLTIRGPGEDPDSRTVWVDISGGQGANSPATVQVARDFWVQAEGVFLSGGEGMAGSPLDITVGRDAAIHLGGGYYSYLHLQGGDGSGNHVKFDVAGFAEVIAPDGSMSIYGGDGENAYARFTSGRSMLIGLGNGLSLSGGNGNGAYALLDPTQPGSVMDIQAYYISVDGGEGAGAYAAITSAGNMVLSSPYGGLPYVSLYAGNGANADAFLMAANGQALASDLQAAGCTTCQYLGLGDPRFNSETQYGVAALGEGLDTILPRLIADQDFLGTFLALWDEELLRRRREGRESIVFEQVCR